MRRSGRLAAVAVSIAVAGCAGPILANPPAQRPASTPRPEPSSPVVDDPQPIDLPRDDAPHERLTEWWYYTGHLQDEGGAEWGFEYVVFRAERGTFPVAWASHLAMTDEEGDRFTYAQRSEIGPQVDRTAGSGSFRFALTGADPSRPGTGGGVPWAMAGAGDEHELAAAADAAEAAGDVRPFALDLELRGGPDPVLHDVDGWIDFGAAGGSYYYSRTSMPTTGTIDVDGATLAVSGFSWFDHQWGDFIAVGGGGWDWFAVNLEDGTALALSLVRDRDGTYPLVYGTVQRPDGRTVHLARDAFAVAATGDWTSPATGATYPAGWRIDVPGEGLVIGLTPTVADQELDTRATTGVVYWEGSQHVDATHNGRPLGGEAYVELTGYGPAGG